MARFTHLDSRAVVLPVNDVDTDQIIPARFLKTTDKEGLGEQLFADWRYNADGTPKPEFVLNRPESGGAQILVAGDNFGCGSSREHAPWALTAFGFRAVISTSFADIFFGNALKNGLLPIRLGRGDHGELLRLLMRDPGSTLSVDLAAQTLTLPGGRELWFPIDSFARTCLLNDVDELGYLLAHAADIEAFERTHGMR